MKKKYYKNFKFRKLKIKTAKKKKIANLYIVSRLKNTLLYLNNINNNGLHKQWSTQSFKGRSKKNTPYNLEKISKNLNKYLKKINIDKLNIFFKIEGSQSNNKKRSILKNLNKFSKYKNKYKKSIFKTGYIFNITPKVFNGCRKRSAKRK